MITFLLRRLFELPVTLLFASAMLFILMHLAPGDPVVNALGPNATPQAVAALRAEYLLDRPLPTQYVTWLVNAVRGDLGRSILTGEPVAKMLADRSAVTLSLTLGASLLFVLVSFPLGALAASRRKFGVAVDVAVALGIGMPSFYLAVILIGVFGLYLRWLPIAGFVHPFEDIRGAARHLVLPIVSLAAFYVALTSKLVRLGVGQALGEDYTRTARAKGLAPSQVLVKHAFRNGLIPATTASAINVAYLLGGAIVIEEIFALPGVGRLLLTAVVNRDFPTIQGIALVSTVVFALCSIVADMLVARFDPRVRLR